MKRIVNPYLIVSLLFLAIVFAGVRFWDWEQKELGFALLLYFVVVLGVRLDEITHQLMEVNENCRRLLAVLKQADENTRAVKP
jgi:hypothetical protein